MLVVRDVEVCVAKGIARKATEKNKGFIGRNECFNRVASIVNNRAETFCGLILGVDETTTVNVEGRAGTIGGEVEIAVSCERYELSVSLFVDGAAQRMEVRPTGRGPVCRPGVKSIGLDAFGRAIRNKVERAAVGADDWI